MNRSSPSVAFGCWVGFAVWMVALTLVATAMLAGCASNPVAVAQTPDQKAYAVYGEFVIFEEQGAKLASDTSVDVHVRQAVKSADAKAKPSADALLKAYQDYSAAQKAVATGTNTADQLSIASANLNQWIATAATDVDALVAAVRSH